MYPDNKLSGYIRISVNIPSFDISAVATG